MITKMKKILLVEDDSAIMDIYTTMMKKAGFEVEVMSLGQDVIKKIKSVESGEEAKPDIILLDLILPDINGAEVLSQIRKTNATKNVVVFILTNQENAENQMPEGIRPDKIIIKASLTPTQLIDTIKKKLK
ncbi:MAG: response regulator transcription factor [Candidatus Staskawiczbacteria bacterium]|nr:response regulator transcription factor [Candidatus Staskawiczbacteria bacterium]